MRYGSASEKQLNFVGKLLSDIGHRAEREAARKAEQDAAAPCPTGKVQVSGVVLTVRVDEGPYGDTTKMLVKADEGFKVWSTMPAHANANRGDRIVFKATVTPSESDPKFGFAKRPRLVSVESAQPAEEAVTA